MPAHCTSDYSMSISCFLNGLKNGILENTSRVIPMDGWWSWDHGICMANVAWEPVRDYYHGLPIWDPSLVFKLASSNPYNRNGTTCYVMALTGTSSLAFTSWPRTYIERECWTVENCTIKEPYANPKQNMQFTNAIGFQGKFYALSLHGSVVVIENVDSRFRITGVGGNRAVPSKVSRKFREYLVESDGEILLVSLVSNKKIDLVEDVEVFGLDVVKILWEKMEGTGDRTLFIEDECCMGVNANDRVGCKRNCIYFTHGRVDGWRIFDMGSRDITSVLVTDNLMWDEPGPIYLE